MQASRNPRLDLAAPALRVACVLLALLILYNPFLALTTSYASFSLHGQARHRATVGASELQHLGSAQNQNPQEAASIQEYSVEFSVPTTESATPGPEIDAELPQPDSRSQVWSRPPPLV